MAEASVRKRGQTGRIVRRILVVGSILLAVIAAVAAVYISNKLRDSLPSLDGEHSLEGLSAPVTVKRDKLGVAAIDGKTPQDVIRALGFVHAQERFFQMDLQRRKAAGELSEILGAAALPMDRELRIHRFRQRARETVAAGNESDRVVLQAYTEGVNAGLAALDASPFEYLLIGIEPEPWQPEDAVLTLFAMYLALQDDTGSRESMLGVMHDLLPKKLADFLTPPGTEYDAPIQGGLYPSLPVPGPEVFDLRTQPTATLDRPRETAPLHAPGSNNWAVAGAHTKHGGAILANDMHLGLGAPNIWYRASYSFVDAAGEQRRITGVTLPGIPAVIAGSNGHIAWGFTNSYGDWSDLVVVETVAGQPGTYLTSSGPRRFNTVREIIQVKDAADENLEITETIWGPIVDTDHRGRKRAYKWVAYEPEGANMGLRRLDQTETISAAFEVAASAGMPAQNFVVADRQGNIGWTITGPIPRRFGHDGHLPSSWARGDCGWNGWLTPAEYPTIQHTGQGRIWTANSRVVDGEALAKIGDGGYAFGARAKQIRDGLLAVRAADETDMLDIQLDDRALYLERWQKVLFFAVTKQAIKTNPRLAELKKHVANWSRRAAVGSVGYRIVRGFREELANQVFGAITNVCKVADDRFEFRRVGRQSEDALYRMVQERPPHLLHPAYKTWDEQLISAITEVLESLLEHGTDLTRRTWGERNTASVRHPMSPFVPLVGRWLDMPSTQLSGDIDMPRVQSPKFGASERMAVSPGREESGYFHMPAGQSGHPLSPYYGAGHSAWEKGEATPFLPGKAVHTLTLVP